MDEPVALTHFDPKAGVLTIGGRDFTATGDPKAWVSGDYSLVLQADLSWVLSRDGRRITKRKSLDALVPFMPIQDPEVI